MNEPNRLLILIAKGELAFDAVVTGFAGAGVAAATVVEGCDLATIVRDELPIFSGLGALLPVEHGSRVILAVTDDVHLDEAMAFLEGLPEDVRPIAMAVPILKAVGLRPAADGTERS